MTSYYLDKFRRGAPLVPECFWAVEPTPDSTPDASAPFFETNIDAYKKSKKRWQFLGRGRIERDFVFMTVRAKYLTPFFPGNQQLIFMPAMQTTNGIKALDSAQLLERGKLYAARWMKDIEQTWQDQRGKQGILFSLHSIMISSEPLSIQHPKKNVVVFNRRGRNLNAAMICPEDDQEYPWNGFIANHNTHFCYPKTRHEGDYLCSMLNSDIVCQLARSHRSETPAGTKVLLWSPFEASPIPQFDPEDSQHVSLAQLSRECRAILQERVAKEETSKKHPPIRRAIQKQIDAINETATSILQQHCQTS